MKLARRRFLHLSTGAAAFLGTSRFANAQTFPARPVRIIVATAPGGPQDILARLIGQWLSERIGQPFIVENRPGGGGNVGTEAVIKATPDGYSLLLVASSSAVNATLYDRLNFNFIRDITPIASITSQPQVMVVHPTFQAKTVPEFIAHAIANPGKLNMASPGIGTTAHMAGELFKVLAGVDMVHVPYRGAGPALADLLGGQVQVMFPATAGAIEYIKSGKLLALAITGAKRSVVLPDVPPLSEFLTGFEASAWFGIGAPSNTSIAIVDKLNKEINAALADPKIKAALANLGGEVISGSPADFGKLIADETEKWAKVIKSAGIKAS